MEKSRQKTEKSFFWPIFPIFLQFVLYLLCLFFSSFRDLSGFIYSAAGRHGHEFSKKITPKCGEHCKKKWRKKICKNLPRLLPWQFFIGGALIGLTWPLWFLVPGGAPHTLFIRLKRVPSYPFLAENPSSEGATKDHLSSKPPQGEPPGTKNQSGR